MPQLSRTAEVTYYVCDICTEECRPFFRRCAVCRNIVCPKAECHTIHSDKPVCKWCWTLQETFLSEIYAEHQATQARIVEINRRWYDASLKLQIINGFTREAIKAHEQEAEKQKHEPRT